MDSRIVSMGIKVFTVTPEMHSPSELMAEGNYALDNYFPRTFFVPPPPKGSVSVYLIPFGAERIGIGAEEVILTARKEGFAQAGYWELLALGAEYPNVQRQFPITALGSRFLYEDDEERVLTITGNDHERILRADYWNVRFGRNTRFLCEPI
ncbi:MAG: hypothetical protein Q7S28_00955 [bacterium]|nr:hypothetical protein [bacterium]